MSDKPTVTWGGSFPSPNQQTITVPVTTPMGGDDIDTTPQELVWVTDVRTHADGSADMGVETIGGRTATVHFDPNEHAKKVTLP